MSTVILSRILLVDDDESFLASMRRILHHHFEIVTTKDPVHALKIIEHQSPFAAVVSDFRMPLMNGIELFARIALIDKHVQRIMLTGHAELQMAIDAVNHGKITAFLTKPTPAASIRAVIFDAIRVYNESIIREQAVAATQNNQLPARQDSTDLYAQLTVKEREVLSLLAKGCSNAEIAVELNITVGTAKSHLNNLFWKMDVNNRTKVVAKAIELGLIKTSPAE